jgi:hypothetical protein
MNTSTTETTEALHPAWLYSTVKQFSERYPAFTVGSLRAIIFNASTNGLSESGAIVRINRRILLNEPKLPQKRVRISGYGRKDLPGGKAFS